MPKLVKYFQVFSLDVCLGALAAGLYAIRITHAPLSYAFFSILFFSVFSIYTLDHLVDAWHIGKKASRFRHKFHYQNFAPIFIVSITSGFAALFLALQYMPRIVLYAGFVLFSGVLLHLLMAQYTKFMPYMKEASVAFYYTAGIWLAPVLLGNAPLAKLLFIVALFYLSVLISLVLFSCFELQQDRQEGSRSIAVYLGQQQTTRLLQYLFVISAVLLGLVLLQDFPGKNWLPPGIVILVHYIILKKKELFIHNDLYRITGDGIFSIYGISFFFSL